MYTQTGKTCSSANGTKISILWYGLIHKRTTKFGWYWLIFHQSNNLTQNKSCQLVSCETVSKERISNSFNGLTEKKINALAMPPYDQWTFKHVSVSRILFGMFACAEEIPAGLHAEAWHTGDLSTRCESRCSTGWFMGSYTYSMAHCAKVNVLRVIDAQLGVCGGQV